MKTIEQIKDNKLSDIIIGYIEYKIFMAINVGDKLALIDPPVKKAWIDKKLNEGNYVFCHNVHSGFPVVDIEASIEKQKGVRQ